MVITIPNFQTVATKAKVKLADIAMLDMDKEIMIRVNLKVPDFIAADVVEIKMKIVQLCVREMEKIFLIRVGIGSLIKVAWTFLSPRFLNYPSKISILYPMLGSA